MCGMGNTIYGCQDCRACGPHSGKVKLDNIFMALPNNSLGTRMKRFVLLLCCILGCFSSSIAYADSADIASELHRALNTADREIMPVQLAAQLIQVRPEYRAKEQEIQRLILEILDSKEYENIRVGYFSKAFDEQQLRDLVVLVRTPAYKLFQRKISEMGQFSGEALIRLSQTKFSQLDNPSRKDSLPIGNRMTFYSEDYGNFFISTWMYFEQVSERLYRLNFSSKVQGSESSYFLLCAAWKFAETRGFDFWVISANKVDEQSGLIGFLKIGESAEALLGEKFAKSEQIQVDNKNIADLCTKWGDHAKARNAQIPNASDEHVTPPARPSP